jgi:hypothetical protein
VFVKGFVCDEDDDVGCWRFDGCLRRVDMVGWIQVSENEIARLGVCIGEKMARLKENARE